MILAQTLKDDQILFFVVFTLFEVCIGPNLNLMNRVWMPWLLTVITFTYILEFKMDPFIEVAIEQICEKELLYLGEFRYKKRQLTN